MTTALPRPRTTGSVVVFSRATAKDDDDLRNLLHCSPMPSWVDISMEREPSFFAGEGLMGPSTAVVARQEQAPHAAVGMYSCAVLPVHVNGRPERIGYLGNLRVHPQSRGRLSLLRNGFGSIRPLAVDSGATLPFWLTSIAQDNVRARRLLELGRHGLPVYAPVGELATLAVSVRQGRTMGLLQQARSSDIPALADLHGRLAAQFQFAPLLTEAWLAGLDGRHGLTIGDFWLLKDEQELHGCLAVWDQRSFKQIVCRGFRFPLNRLRRLHNLLARLTGRAGLPALGQRLEQVFLAFAAFSSQAAGTTALAAVREALAKVRDKGAAVGVIGLSPANPLCRSIRRALPALAYVTCLETVVEQGQPAPLLDGRPPQPEAAVL